MANWQNKLTLTDVWGKVDSKEMTVQELGKIVASRIRNLKCYEDEVDTLEDLAFQFANVSDVEDFDGLMGELYDWGDIPLDNSWNGKKMCWIATSF